MSYDLISAYAVTLARVSAWIVVSALVFRRLGAEALGIVTLVRATVGILTYTSMGLGPALVKLLVDAARPIAARAIPVAALAGEDEPQTKPLLKYSRQAPEPPPDGAVARIYITGEMLAASLGVVALALAGIYAMSFDKLHDVNASFEGAARSLVMLMGTGTVFRLISDAPSGLLQARGRIALDNWLVVAAELAWGAATAIILLKAIAIRDGIAAVGWMFMFASLGLLIARAVAGRMEARTLTGDKARPDRATGKQILSLGGLIMLSQVADFLYAPTDCILIERFLGADFVAYYSPAIQIDAGLLLLVSGLAVVLYPKSAIAHAAGDVAQLKRYYVRGTLISFVLLLCASLVVWLTSRWIFLLWFASDMPQTRAILPLLLIHTVIGGSSAVGRSILLAVGKAKQFTVAVLLAGVSNVILSWLLVRYTDLGLKGIVLGTIIVVVVRCALWIPWYVQRTLRTL